MTILHFGAHQNDVFVPALVAALVATVLLVLPVVFVSLARRSRRGRSLTIAGAVVAAVALVVAGQQTASGFGALHAERVRVAQELRSEYGLEVTDDEVRSLIDGDPVKLSGTRVLLRSAGGTAYEVLANGEVLPRQA